MRNLYANREKQDTLSSPFADAPTKPIVETPQQKLARLMAASKAKKEVELSNETSKPSTGNQTVESDTKTVDSISKNTTNPQINKPITSNNLTNSNNSNNSISPASRLAALKLKIAEAKSNSVAATIKTVESTPTELNSLSNNLDSAETVGTNASTGQSITYNEQQLRFIELAGSGQSTVLIGAAGTGKTTCQRGAITKLIQSGLAGVLEGEGHKHLPVRGTPGIVVVAYTRRAVANIRRNMPDDMKANCLTAHALLEYEPVYYTVTTEDGEKNTMSFEPTRNADKPLSATIRTCVIEEGSMMSVELFNQLRVALPSNCQFIFLGDIQQLPPVFGSAILGFKMLELPTIELTTVYRQALESPIIRLAHQILSGVPIPASEYPAWKTADKLTLHPWKKKLHPDLATITMAKFLTVAIDNGVYNSDEDMILIPFNKGFGTTEINKHVAQHLARKRQELVWEIIAGFNKHYFSIGDRVLYEKEDATIVNISRNPDYTGNATRVATKTLDYWGFDSGSDDVDEADGDMDDMLSAYVLNSSDSEDRVRQASHTITVKLADSGTEVKLSNAANINNLLLSYALTVHKSQGSEFRKVFLLLHESHATMLQRELLYTAVTRAKEELYVICEPESFTKGILRQRIKGNTLEEKAEHFKGKLEDERKLS